MLVFAEHGDLREQRKLDVVLGGTERSNLGVAARLLAFEVIGRKAQHFKAVGALRLVQAFQSAVLRRETTLRCHINHQQDLATILREAAVLTVNRFQGDVM